MDNQHDLTDETADDEVRARREFLTKCGKYAVVVPPVMVLLMTRANANGSICIIGSNGDGCASESGDILTAVP